jgi:hypothetical protein
MIAILTGDIIHSSKLKDPDLWLQPLKTYFNEWGNTPSKWEIFRGDSFQLEIDDPALALQAALHIKAIIKSVSSDKDTKRTSVIDVRMAIGIGDKTHDASNISESNGSAFINSGQRFESLKKEKSTLAIKSPWSSFDKEMNLIIKLASIQMDSWSISSGELMQSILSKPNHNQQQIGKELGIEQNSVSGRYKRANVDEILEMERMYRDKLKHFQP